MANPQCAGSCGREIPGKVHEIAKDPEQMFCGSCCPGMVGSFKCSLGWECEAYEDALARLPPGRRPKRVNGPGERAPLVNWDEQDGARLMEPDEEGVRRRGATIARLWEARQDHDSYYRAPDGTMTVGRSVPTDELREKWAREGRCVGCGTHEGFGHTINCPRPEGSSKLPEAGLEPHQFIDFMGRDECGVCGYSPENRVHKQWHVRSTPGHGPDFSYGAFYANEERPYTLRPTYDIAQALCDRLNEQNVGSLALTDSAISKVIHWLDTDDYGDAVNKEMQKGEEPDMPVLSIECPGRSTMLDNFVVVMPNNKRAAEVISAKYAYAARALADKGQKENAALCDDICRLIERRWDIMQDTDGTEECEGFENPGSKQVLIDYTNYRDETSTRSIIPAKLWYGHTEHHPTNQWLLDALDVSKDAIRTFAMQDIHTWAGDHGPTEKPEIPVALPSVLYENEGISIPDNAWTEIPDFDIHVWQGTGKAVQLHVRRSPSVEDASQKNGRAESPEDTGTMRFPCATATDPTCATGCDECLQAPISVAELRRKDELLSRRGRDLMDLRNQLSQRKAAMDQWWEDHKRITDELRGERNELRALLKPVTRRDWLDLIEKIKPPHLSLYDVLFCIADPSYSIALSEGDVKLGPASRGEDEDKQRAKELVFEILHTAITTRTHGEIAERIVEAVEDTLHNGSRLALENIALRRAIVHAWQGLISPERNAVREVHDHLEHYVPRREMGPLDEDEDGRSDYDILKDEHTRVRQALMEHVQAPGVLDCGCKIEPEHGHDYPRIRFTGCSTHRSGTVVFDWLNGGN